MIYINKMSNLNGNKGICGNYFITKKREKLEGMKKEIETKFKTKIDNLNNGLKSLEKSINEYITWLDKITPNIPDNNNINMQKRLNEELRINIKNFFDSFLIYYNKNFKVIDSKIELNKLFEDIISFDFSPDENDGVIFSSDSNLNEINDYSQKNYNFDNSRKEFISNFDKEEEVEKQNTFKDNSFEEMSDKCFLCKVNKSSYSYLNKLYCKELLTKLLAKCVMKEKFLIAMILFILKIKKNYL